MNFIPHTEEDLRQMLTELGVDSIEQLFAEIPREVRLQQTLQIPGPMAEPLLARHLNRLAAKNSQLLSFLGAGAYQHYIPSAVRHLIMRSEFYTAYTPYQAEMSQGMLQAIFEYQSIICELTGMDVANASMYDGASATAEAALMACAATRRSKVLISKTVHPEYREVLRTYALGPELQIEEIDFEEGATDLNHLNQLLDQEVAAVIIQQPNFFGVLEDLTAISQAAHGAKALTVACADPVALGLIADPGSCGVDIAVGEGQSLGIPLSYGGPYLGFMACTDKLLRRMPGRIVGETTDSKGQRGFVLTLQAREQHIRREKATSNICSNQALCALAATVHLSLLGPEGLKQVAEQCLQKAHFAYQGIINLPGFSPVWSAPFFKEFVVRLPHPAEEINKALLDQGIIGGLNLAEYYPEMKNCMLFCVTEVHTREEIERLVEALRGFSK
ncbi:aminomethyl-transferring glycine dehydrogenase subunit GcvPA [Desulfofalx alkaliphila]|uniref:aminomethyl-transferring glycine dehydrogenase subunit GcvPA n=1 Tax=Desulfofalx alkaliphila TaxID=105483 RepID=UPI0004E2638A|nr:aminomethyl-transferring glycine dehydrogenase subunit GcvPA [Desulfofalx alkaliphila]